MSHLRVSVGRVGLNLNVFGPDPVQHFIGGKSISVSGEGGGREAEGREREREGERGEGEREREGGRERGRDG